MSTFGRIAVVAVVAGVLVTGTLVAAHYLMKSPEPGPAAAAHVPAPTMVETPTGTAGVGVKHVVARSGDGTAKVLETGSPVAPVDPPTPGAVAPGSGGAAADEGLAMLGDRPVQAQKILSDAIRAGVDGQKGSQVRAALIALADNMQLSPQIVSGDTYSRTYKVAGGDSLTSIGKGCSVPAEMIARINGLHSSVIRKDQTLKVLQGPVTIEIYKGRRELQAWVGNVCIRVYSCAIGADNKTPEGTFTVKDKVMNPPYQPQHKTGADFKASGAKDNPLGTRWIKLDEKTGSYGIHGTIDPTSIGAAVSDGCVRLLNKEVEELYDMVVVGSKVTIRP
jgi:lipoprotein-anchoring transpeptidase ErfK/SrfK